MEHKEFCPNDHVIHDQNQDLMQGHPSHKEFRDANNKMDLRYQLLSTQDLHIFQKQNPECVQPRQE